MRNGGNPLTNEDLGREAHWFDGDGMLSGVLFRRTTDPRTGAPAIAPEFVNQFILTDVNLTTRGSRFLHRPLLPSIATLVNPLRSLLEILHAILRTLVLVALSWLPGGVGAPLKRISVANTNVLWHDGRALTTCESGPPLRVLLPGLETVGWFNGRRAENEPLLAGDDKPGYGGAGVTKFLTEWTTGHPRVDPHTNELIAFHATFVPPYVRYSIVPATQSPPTSADTLTKAPTLSTEASTLPFFDCPVPGVSGAKMMHDFGVSHRHTVIIDLPLTLDPARLMYRRPPVEYDAHGRARFGVFPRYEPQRVRWFETRACCVFHTANAWETTEKAPGAPGTEQEVVHLLACRLTSAAMVYNAGNMPTPTPPPPRHPHAGLAPATAPDEQCRLYYYQFPLDTASSNNVIRHQWALSAIPFDFPSLRPTAAMSEARYFYGCTTSASTFTAALGRAAKIDALAKIDARTLIQRGLADPPAQVDGCVDLRSVLDVARSTDPTDPIKVFVLPKGWFAQEPRFVPRAAGTSEDDGWLLSYVFDENEGIDPRTGLCRDGARSELWAIDAKNMRDVVARVRLPQRVPYGLHGNWFDENMVRGQRPVAGVRRVLDPEVVETEEKGKGPWSWRACMRCREAVERALA